MDPVSLRAFLDELTKIAEHARFESVQHAEKNLRPGDILLTERRDGHPFSRLVGKFQGTRFSHAAMYLGGGEIGTSAATKGVHSQAFKDFADTYRFKAYRVQDTTKREAAEAAAFVKKEIGKGYNYFRMLRQINDVKEDGTKKVEKPDEYTCSQLIAHAYEVPFSKSRTADNVRPVDFQRSRVLVPVGMLR